MWDIPRFAEYHRYPIVLVENVTEAITKWQPARAWLMAMDSLGYQHEIISHNAMHAQAKGLPAPQSRDRVYVAFWDRRMKRPDWDSVQRPQAYCPRCDRLTEAAKAWKQRKDGPPLAGKYRTQYLYSCTGCGTIVEPGWLPASTAIDWTLPAERIADRARPLSDKTMARIREGLRRYGPYYSSSETAKPTSDPIGTLTTVDRYALVTLRGTNAPKPVSAPLDTVAASGNHHCLMSVTEEDVMACRFRMLEPHEIAAGMSFPSTYRWQGTKRERVRLAGNAVTPPAARDLVACVVGALS